MNVRASKQFFRDLAGIKSAELFDDAEFIYDLAHACSHAEDIPGFKWMTGYPTYGRISLSEYRIGIKVSGNTITFICLIHRSVIYKQFP